MDYHLSVVEVEGLNWLGLSLLGLVVGTLLPVASVETASVGVESLLLAKLSVSVGRSFVVEASVSVALPAKVTSVVSSFSVVFGRSSLEFASVFAIVVPFSSSGISISATNCSRAGTSEGGASASGAGSASSPRKKSHKPPAASSRSKATSPNFPSFFFSGGRLEAPLTVPSLARLRGAPSARGRSVESLVSYANSRAEAHP